MKNCMCGICGCGFRIVGTGGDNCSFEGYCIYQTPNSGIYGMNFTYPTYDKTYDSNIMKIVELLEKILRILEKNRSGE